MFHRQYVELLNTMMKFVPRHVDRILTYPDLSTWHSGGWGSWSGTAIAPTLRQQAIAPLPYLVQPH